MIHTGKHKQLAVALNLQKFYFGFKTIVQSFSSMDSSNPSLWISKPYEMIRCLHTCGHYHNFRFAPLYYTKKPPVQHRLPCGQGACLLIVCDEIDCEAILLYSVTL